jgi:hypothetical protein
MKDAMPDSVPDFLFAVETLPTMLTAHRPPPRPIAVYTFHHAADGTVTATCGNTAGTGTTEKAAMWDLQQRLLAAQKAAELVGC